MEKLSRSLKPLTVHNKSCTIEISSDYRPRGRPSGSVLKSRFNPRDSHINSPYNTLTAVNPRRTMKHSFEYMNRGTVGDGKVIWQP